MSLRCFLGYHEIGRTVARGNALHVKCDRCDRISPGVVIDGPKPRPTQPAKRSPIWWLRGIYETSKGA